MLAIARIFSPLLVLAAVAAAVPATSQIYDTPLMVARAQKLERDLRAKLIRPNERPQPGLVKPAAETGMALARERKFAEALPLLERAIAHGGNDHLLWSAYANALGSKRPPDHELALDAAYQAWKKAPDNKTRAAALFQIGYWHEQLRRSDEAIAAYEDSLKADNNAAVRKQLVDVTNQYRHQLVNAKAETEATQPRLCLTFSKPLATSDPNLFAPFIAVNPQIRPAFEAKDRTLCIAGVIFGQSYRVTVRSGLPSTTPLKTLRDETVTIAVPDRSPSVAFRSRAHILPRASRQGLPLASVNVERAKLRVLRINDRNFVHELNSERVREMLDYFSARRIERTTGELVWSGTLRIRGERNRETSTAIPFADIVKDPKPGVYIVVAKPDDARDDEEQRYSDWATQWVVVTDLGVTTFSGEEGLVVFTRSFETAEPRSGVTVRLLARNNEILGTSVTDAAGRASFAPGLLRGSGGSRPAALVVTTGTGEFTYLDIARPAFDLTDRGVGGREAPGPADAFVFTERGVYRPGETVHATALLRDQNGIATADLPLIVKLMRPDGIEAQRLTLKQAGAGGYTVSLPIAKSAATGAWRLDAFLDPNARPIGSVRFQVEDFVPERTEMTLTAEPKTLEPGKSAMVKVEGRFLYGAPAADLAVDAELNIRSDSEPFPDHKGFVFGLAQESFDPLRLEVPSATTDAKGNATLELTLERALAATKPLVGELRVTLNEEGGRSIERVLKLPVQLRALHLGLKLDSDEPTVGEGRTARFLAIAVDRQGRRVAANGLAYELVREIYEYQWYKQGESWNYRAMRRDEPVEKGGLNIGAGRPADISFDTPPGRYRLELVDPDSGAGTSLRYAVGWSYGGDDADEVPDKLAVRLDKPSYKAGERAKISIQSPFEGHVHVVIAGHRLFASRHEKIAAGSTVIEVPVEDSWGTGVYVLATAYRPNGKAEKLGPMRAIGLAYLARDTDSRVLAVRIDTPDTIAPRRRLEAKISVSGAESRPVFLTLAAVDEGILALTGYKTPAPDAHFFGKRKLALELRDDYGRLIDAYAGRLGEIRQGGDDRARQLGGLDASSIATVALFSGIVQPDAGGQATVAFDIPDFNGKLRLMAVAWTRDKVGKAERPLLVRDPVVSTVTLPRFLAPGDRARMTVVLHNVDGPPGAYRVRLGATGAVSAAAPVEQHVQIGRDQRARLFFNLNGAQPGTAALQLAVSGPQNFALQRNFELAVRPAQPATSHFVAAEIAKGAAFTVGQRELAEFLPGTAALHLSVGTAPDLGIADLLVSLDAYPYGCAEQTTSRALPLLYFAEVARAIGVAKDDVQLRARVQGAIDRVLAMQLRDGGFGLWSAFDDGGGWLTAYVMDFLTQARARNYLVPDIVFQSGLNRLEALTRELTHDEAELAVLAYAHAVLAANRRGDIAAARYLADTQLALMPTALAKAHLAAALTQLGDAQRSRTALEAAKSHSTRPLVAGRFWQPQLRDYGSLLRDQAGVLHVAALAQPGDADLSALIASVRRNRQSTRFLSTQEQAFMLLAAHRLSARSAGFKVRIAGREVAGTGAPFNARYGAPALAQPFTVQNAGEDKIWVGATFSGIPAKDQPREEKGFEIARAFYTLKGERADPQKLRQGEVLVAVLRLSAKSARPHQALIVDLLPAGFEIENPRLDRRDPEQMKWLPKLAQPRAVEPRDDRFVAAVDLDETTRDATLAYIVRAVTPGTFRQPAAFVEDMYAPSFYGRDAIGAITILPRQ